MNKRISHVNERNKIPALLKIKLLVTKEKLFKKQNKLQNKLQTKPKKRAENVKKPKTKQLSDSDKLNEKYFSHPKILIETSEIAVISRYKKPFESCVANINLREFVQKLKTRNLDSNKKLK